jgi:hypothetical protein
MKVITALLAVKADGSDDGTTMHLVDADEPHGTKLTYTADKKAM